MSLNFLTIPTKFLSQSITSASTYFKVNNIKSWALDSVGRNIDLTSADFGTQAYCCFRNDTGTVIEIMEIDPATIASSSITFIKRGLPFDGTTTPVATYKLDWPAGSIVQFGTDVPQLFQYLKEYIDGVAIAGAPNASTTIKGITEEATQAEVSAGTSTGGTGARLFINPSTLLDGVATSNNSLFTFESTSGATHSLTTVAGERVMVWAKGVQHTDGSQQTVTLAYNSVTKDQCTLDSNVDGIPVSLMYTEIPGAATANITLTTSTPTLSQMVILVLKMKTS